MTHSFVPSVGDHVVVGFGNPGGTVQIHIIDFSEDGEPVEARLLADVGPVIGGDVLRLFLSSDAEGGLNISEFEWSEPSEEQIATATAMGIDPMSGSLTIDLLDSLPNQT